MTRSVTGALSGRAVIDCSDTISGQFATRLMADNGASVSLVEPPEGSVLRRCPPFRNGRAGDSLLFWHLNGGKESLVLENLDVLSIVEHCRDADVVVTRDDQLARLIVDECSRPIVGVTSEFGDEGPYAEWRGCELVYQALSGSMYVTGSPEREPLYGVGHRASYSAGAWLYVGLLAALHSRQSDRSAISRIVEVTNHEAAAAMEENFSTQWQYSRTLAHRGLANGRAVWPLECSDGWVVLFARTGEWRTVSLLLGASHLANDPRFATWGDVLRNHSDAGCELQRHARNFTVGQLLELTGEHGVVADAVVDGADLWTEPQLKHRNYWQTVTTSGEERVNLGPAFRLSAAEVIRDRPAPRIGSQTKSPRTATEYDQSWHDRDRGTKREPLAGVSVVEITTAWAGPMCSRILATLGADVIKVEGPGKLDSWRGPMSPYRLELYPDKEPGEKPYDRCAQFNAQNSGKRSLVLDLKQERGRDLLLEMSTEVDIVITNLRPGAMDELGLGFYDFARRNDGIIYVEMPPYGDGPLSHRTGLGPTMEARTGITDLIGYQGGGPIGSGSSYLDPMGAVHGAAATLSALHHREATGRGQRVEVAQRDAAMHWIGELLLDSVENGHWPQRTGNALESVVPHNAFPAQGVDEWIVLAAFTDQQWEDLCDVLTTYGHQIPESLVSGESRSQRRHEIEEVLAIATATLDKHELANRLQAVGVPAAPILNGKELLEDPHLRARGWFTTLAHPAVGAYEYPSVPLRFDRARPHPRCASPAFGQDTISLLSDYAGLDQPDIDKLAAASVVVASKVDLSHGR